MKTQILTKKTGAGHYEIILFQNNNKIGSFETTDMQLVDDIEEMRNDGFESELMTCETFEELVSFCIKKINISKMKEEHPFGIDNFREHKTKFDGTQLY